MSHITARGHVDAFLVSPDGRRTQVAGGANTLLFSCADAVAGIFAGIASRRPAVIGFVYGDDKTLGANFAFTAGDRATRRQADIVGTGLQVFDQYIEQNRRFSASAPEYRGNAVTLSASKPGVESPVYVYGVMLKDADGNVLAVKRFDECVLQNVGYAFAVSWTVTFM